MTHDLEALLHTLCKQVTKGQQNPQQTLYILSDAKDAKLAYDLLISCGLDAKYFADADGSSAKLYVQNASLAHAASRISAAISSASLLKHIKALLDAEPQMEHYSLAFSNTPAGHQLTLLFPADKTHSAAAPVAETAIHSATESTNPAKKSMKSAKKQLVDEERMTTGPAVARVAIPKSLQSSTTEEDPLLKRLLFYMTSRAFSSVAWGLLLVMILAIIFTIIVTVRGFLCPDVATDARNIPSYCPRKAPAS